MLLSITVIFKVIVEEYFSKQLKWTPTQCACNNCCTVVNYVHALYRLLLINIHSDAMQHKVLVTVFLVHKRRLLICMCHYSHWLRPMLACAPSYSQYAWLTNVRAAAWWQYSCCGKVHLQGHTYHIYSGKFHKRKFFANLFKSKILLLKYAVSFKGCLVPFNGEHFTKWKFYKFCRIVKLWTLNLPKFSCSMLYIHTYILRLFIG